MTKFSMKLLAASVLMGLSCSTFAAVDLDADPIDPFDVAAETDFTTDSILTDAAGGTAFTKEIEFGGVAGTTFYVKFTMNGGATFVGTPALTATTSTTTGTVGTGVTGVLVDGGDGENFARFAFTIPDNEVMAATNVLTLTPSSTADEGIDLGAGTSDITVDYELVVDFPNNTATKEANGLSYIQIADSWSVDPDGTKQGTDNTTDVASIAKIDVTTGNTKFVGGISTTTTVLGEIDITETANPGTTGTNFLTTERNVTLTEGDFSAATEVWLDSNSSCGNSGGSNTFDLTADPLVLPLGPVDIDGLADTVYVCMSVDGTSVIPVSTYKASVVPVVATGFITPAATTVNLASIEKNASTAEIEGMVGGAYAVISNPSSVSGNVYVTVSDSSGTTVGPFLMGAIAADAAGTSVGDTVPAGGSVSLEGRFIRQAAEAEDATLSDTGPYRVVFDAETSDIRVEAWQVTTNGRMVLETLDSDEANSSAND